MGTAGKNISHNPLGEDQEPAVRGIKYEESWSSTKGIKLSKNLGVVNQFVMRAVPFGDLGGGRENDELCCG